MRSTHPRSPVLTPPTPLAKAKNEIKHFYLTTSAL
jgi:hypothetical protein